jgi:hypothetical protein
MLRNLGLELATDLVLVIALDSVVDSLQCGCDDTTTTKLLLSFWGAERGLGANQLSNCPLPYL